MKGKIHPPAPKSQGTGPVYTTNDPIKFPNKGKFSGKTKAAPVSQSTGAVFTENSTLMPSWGGKGSPKESKIFKTVEGHVDISSHDTVKSHTASQSGSGGPTTVPYQLKESYEKSGKHGSAPNLKGWS